MSTPLIPKDKRGLRACLICGIVLNMHSFRDHGCPNCDRFVKMRGHSDLVTDCTSSTFDGLTAMFQPKGSWLAKFTHINSYVPGMYAAHVTGRLPEDIEDMLTQNGITYHPRDGTTEE